MRVPRVFWIELEEPRLSEAQGQAALGSSWDAFLLRVFPWVTSDPTATGVLLTVVSHRFARPTSKQRARKLAGGKWQLCIANACRCWQANVTDAVLTVCFVGMWFTKPKPALNEAWQSSIATLRRLFTLLQTRGCLCLSTTSRKEACRERETVLGNAAVFSCAELRRGYVLKRGASTQGARGAPESRLTQLSKQLPQAPKELTFRDMKSRTAMCT